MPQHFALFLMGSVVITVVPGADMALVTRQVVTRGRGAAQATIFGNLSGLVVHAGALAVGLSALLVASATAYTTVKLAGAAYLVYLGVQSFRQARKSTAGDVEAPGTPRRRRYSGNAYVQGLISTVLNPKPALFFLSYVPQFIDRQGSVAFQVALLGAVHIAVGFAWLTAFAWLVSRMHAVIIRPRVKASLARVTGAVLIALGLRVALEKR
jgi:threonine/homoserine/homoserine lactone efflux protein